MTSVARVDDMRARVAARVVGRERELDLVLAAVEGNADLTPGKLRGHHNPAWVLREDCSADRLLTGS